MYFQGPKDSQVNFPFNFSSCNEDERYQQVFL